VVSGGACVLGSYAHGLITNPSIRGGIWGSIPDPLRPYYTIFMFLAAGGYFFFTGYFLIHVSTESVKLFGHYGFWAINMLYAGIIGLIFFCIQTMLLDALIWPYY
jgi:hypothetical protein